MKLSHIVELLLLGEANKSAPVDTPRQRATPVSNSRTSKYEDSILVPISDTKLVTELKKFQAVKDEPLPEFILDQDKMNAYGYGHSQAIRHTNRVHGQSMLRTKIRNLIPLNLIPKLAAIPDGSKTIKNYQIKQLADGGIFSGEIEKTIRAFQNEKRSEFSEDAPYSTTDLERLRRQLLSAIDRGYESAESGRAKNVGGDAIQFKSPDSKIKLIIPPTKKNQDTRIEDLGFTFRDFVAYYICNNIIDAWSIPLKQAAKMMSSHKPEHTVHAPKAKMGSNAEDGDVMRLQKGNEDGTNIQRDVDSLLKNPNYARRADF